MPRTLGLRQSVAAPKKKKTSGTPKKGWRGNFRDRLDIPKGEGTYIVLTPASHPMRGRDLEANKTKDNPDPRAHFHTCLTHSVKLAPSGPKSYYKSACNIDAGDEDCLLCYLADTGDKRVGTSYTYSFSCLQIGLFERVPRTINGRPMVYEKDTDNAKRGDPILGWERVERPKATKRILSNLPELLSKGKRAEEGGVCMVRKKYIEVGRGYRTHLAAIADEAAKLCECGGNLTPCSFSCESCDAELLHVGEEDLTPEEVLAYASDRQRCPECAHVGLPVPQAECDNCDEPSELTAFDVVVKIRRAGERAQSILQIEEIIRLDEFSLADGSSMLDWEGIDERGQIPEDADPIYSAEGYPVFTNKHGGSRLKGIRDMAENAWDFSDIHKPTGHGYHAMRLRVDVPEDFTPSKFDRSNSPGRTPGRKRYGKPRRF